MTPPTMRARHTETLAWETLTLDDEALFWLGNAAFCYYNADLDEHAYHVDLCDYDAFEGVMS